MIDTPVINVYSALSVAGVLITAFVWSKMARDGRTGHLDSRLTVMYFAGLVGAIVGAKLAFLVAEGWAHRTDWLALLSGRSVTGALLGGYAAVEVAKKRLRYPRTTGDFFAVIVPLALAIGRNGCIVQGCCPGRVCGEAHWWTLADADGVARWPAAPVELIFNLAFLLWVATARRFGWAEENRFHVYLIAYGAFRFVHEFARADQPLLGVWTGYHVVAVMLVIFGAWRYIERKARRAGERAPLEPNTSSAFPVSS